MKKLGGISVFIRSRTTSPSKDPQSSAARRMRSATLILAICAVVTTLCSVDASAQQEQPAGERPRVPMVSTQGPPKRIEGKIIRSSRGKKGPVRLLVERKDGEPVTVLVAPEEVCDQLGLSLKADEQVVVDGTMLKSDRPILIATAFVVGDKTIRVRDAEGKIIDARASTGGAPAPAATTAAAAVSGAGKPEPSPKP